MEGGLVCALADDKLNVGDDKAGSRYLGTSSMICM